MSINKIIQIFKRDIKSTIKNPAVILAIIVIIILPSLYALLNIDAFWDPYGNTENMDFAIVNNDKNISYNGQSLNFGDQIVDELKNNNDFNWTFIDKQKAMNGLENGSYYAAIVIPENFTQNILSIDSLNPRKANLTFIINEKTNPVATKMCENAANMIQSKINYNVVQSVDSEAFKQLTVIGANSKQPTLNSLSQVNSSDVEDYFYSPVDLDKQKTISTDNYGSDLAPFYIALSIWVGGIICVALLKTRYLGQSSYSPLEVYFGKMGLFIILGILQSTVTLIGCFCLGIQMENPLMFVLGDYLITIAFIVLIYSFVSLIGNAGKALAILILVLQISTTNGIYPIEVMNSFFQYLSPYMPMTYGINIIRNALLGMYWPTFKIGVIAMFIILIAIIIISILIKEKFDKPVNKFEQLIEESELF